MARNIVQRIARCLWVFVLLAATKGDTSCRADAIAFILMELMIDLPLELLEEFAPSVRANIVSWLVEPEITAFAAYRRAALANYPVLVPILARNLDLPAWRELAAIIDRNDDIAEGLAAIVGVRSDSAAFMRNKGPALLGDAWLENPIALLWAVDVAPSHALPRSTEDWLAFRRFWRASNLHQSAAYREPMNRGRKTDTLAEHVFRQLCASGYAAAEKGLLEIWPIRMLAMQRIDDYLTFVVAWCEVERAPANGSCKTCMSPLDSNELATKLLRRYTPLELFRQSHVWHRDFGAVPYVFDTAGDPEVIGASWPPLLPCHVSAYERTVACLNTTASVWCGGDHFGESLCDLVTNCHHGWPHLLVVGTLSGAISSVAEIDVDRQGGSITGHVIRHFCKDGTEPPTEDVAAVEYTMEILRQPTMQAHLESLEAWHLRSAEAWLHKREHGWAPQYLRRAMERVLPDYQETLDWLKKGWSLGAVVLATCAKFGGYSIFVNLCSV